MIYYNLYREEKETNKKVEKRVKDWAKLERGKCTSVLVK